MRIGELARRSGLPTRTIRYYESIGLILAPRRSSGGYRLYDDSALARLEFIRKAQRLGLSLAETRDIARLRDGGAEPCSHVLSLLDRQIERVEAVRSQLDVFVKELRGLRLDVRRRSAGRVAVCGIIEHAETSDGRGLAPLFRDGRR